MGLSCVPCNGDPGCDCLLDFIDRFVASNSSTWDCVPEIARQPLRVLNAGYSINLDYQLVIWFQAASDLLELPYQFASDLVLTLRGLAEGTDFALAPIETLADRCTVTLTFLRSLNEV